MRILVIATTMASLSFGCTHMGSNKKQETGQDVASKTSQFRVIDAHVHTNFDNKVDDTASILYSKEQLLKEMNEAGVVAAVSMQKDHLLGQENLAKSKIFSCAGLREKIDYRLLEKQLKNKDVYCIKIYLGYVHKFASDKHYQPAYQLAKKYKVPVVFHTGDIWSSQGKLKYSDPMTVDEVAVDHPDVTFVIAHMGNPWIQTAAEVAYKNPNVILEGSAFFAGNINEYTPERIQTQMVNQIKWIYDYVENPKKIIFGTDWPLVPVRGYLEAFKKAIPKDQWNLVFYENAKRVYNLPIQ